MSVLPVDIHMHMMCGGLLYLHARSKMLNCQCQEYSYLYFYRSRMIFFWMLLLKGVLTQNTIFLGRNKITNYCYDENETLMFVCSVEDDSHHAATVWSGTAFNCSSVFSITDNQIYLAHLQYSSFAYGSCNDGAFSAEGIEFNNSLYTSTLTVMPGSLEVPNGKTIDCSLSGATIFGLVIFRVGETSQLLTVSWTEPLGVTGGVGGFLVDASSDCGQCINVGIVSANVTDMSCSGWDPIGQTCNISVYTVTAYCQIQSEVPLLFAIHFKLPEIPNITAIIVTYELSGNLKRITTTLSKKQNTTDENGLTVIYVLAYTHSSIGSNPVEVLLDCSESIDCMDVFEVDQAQKFGEYSVAVGAMTPIGKTVQHSNNSLTIGVANTFMYATVDVLESYTIVNCFFLAKYDHISCQVEYSHDCNRLSNSKRRSVVNASDVSILLESISPSTVYCFVLTADNQSHTVKVQGNFSGYSLLSNACNSSNNSGNNSSNNSSNNSGNNSSNNSGNNSGNILSTSLIVIMGVTILMALVALITLVAIIIVLYKKKNSSIKSDEPVEPVYYSAVKPVAGEGAPDPTYDVISAVKMRDIPTEANEAYHPVSVQPNEAYQTTNIMNVN
ncbi:uncharacterized protein LOC135339611 isoform X3 [Halichondria panicea]|uniref:uncharacterized protein LOC135339611 isoform X3 n=1 Tax=Halichondria panicea TaxID=6063 RepID=UPI00312B7078